MPDELEMHLGWALSPAGGGPDLRQKEISIGYLLEHADAAYPRLHAALEKNPDALDAPAIIELLPRFQRAESIALLEGILLRGREYTARAAGAALGRFPEERATRALIDALSSAQTEALIGAAVGLLAGNARGACPALRELLRHSDAAVRYHSVRAAAHLQCIEPSDWALLERDSDKHVRELSLKLHGTAPQ